MAYQSVLNNNAAINPQDFLFGSSSLGGSGGASPAAGFNTASLGKWGAAGAGADTGLGLNLPTGQLALQTLGSLGSIFSAFNAQKLAKKQFEYTKNVTDTNLGNSIQSYNTTLADRARARGAMEGQTQAQVDGYVASNSLRRAPQ